MIDTNLVIRSRRLFDSSRYNILLCCTKSLSYRYEFVDRL